MRKEEIPRVRHNQPIVEVIVDSNSLKTKEGDESGHEPGEDPGRVLETERQNLVAVCLVQERETEKTPGVPMNRDM